MISAGLPLAGQRITLRPDGPVAHILSRRHPSPWVRHNSAGLEARQRV
jgi:hypothetical protein